MQMKKEIVLSLKPMTKTSQINDLAGKIHGRCLQTRTQSQMAFPRWRLEGVFTWTVNIC